MKITAKILFFNANEGKGILITSNKEKIDFTVSVWDDFEIMPSLGLEVVCLYENDELVKIVSLENEADLNVSDADAPHQEDKQVVARETEAVSQEKVEDTLVQNPSQDSQKASVQEEQVDSDEEKPAPEEDEIEYHESQKSFDKGQTEKLGEPLDKGEYIIPLTLEDIPEDEIPPREESISISMNLPKAVANYLDIIVQNVQKRQKYKEVDGRLNYLVIRRFLWTTFNNVSELDLNIITPKIKALSSDLKEMSRLYDDFMRKIKHPALAYEEVFLSCQAEYLNIRDGAEKTINKLNALKNNEQFIGEALKVKKEELENNMNSEEFDTLKDDFKSMNGAYVDMVHMMAELDERYKHDMQLLVEFEKEYREDFYELFETAALELRRNILDILSAQAYILDAELWQQAKISKDIKEHFTKSGISGDLNTKTYLKYYLDTLDVTKITEDTQKLYDLYGYLCTVYKEGIMLVCSNASDAMGHEVSVRSSDKSYEVKAFIDEKSALKWALKHSVKVLVLEGRLAKMRAETFLHYYKKYILLTPKIIVLGESIESKEYEISKLLSSGVSSKVLADSVSELIKK